MKDVRNYYAFEKCILFCGNKNSEVDSGCLKVSKRGVGVLTLIWVVNNRPDDIAG